MTKDDIAKRRAELSARRDKLLPEHQALLEKQLQGQMTKNVQMITRRAEYSPVPLSLNQQRLWFLYQWEPDSHAYNIFTAKRLYGKLNMGVLNRSFNEVVQRHEILRTRFTAVNGQPMQVIEPNLPVVASLVDLRRIPLEAGEVEARQIATRESQQPFHLTKGPLVRLTVLQLGHEEQALLLSMHHIISDGWSVTIFVDEMFSLYQTYLDGLPSPLADLPIQYADFAVWQRHWLQGETFQALLSYWQKQLESAPALLALPSDRLRPPVQTFRGKSYLFQLNPDLSQRIKLLSQQAGTTLFMTMEAVFAILLSRYSYQECIFIGTPVGNRHYQEIEPLIGFFVNTLVLGNDLSGNPTFWEFLNRVKQMTLQAHENRDFPFEVLVQEMQHGRDPSHNPLFQVMFLLGGVSRREVKRHKMAEITEGVRADSWDMDNDIALFDLLLGLEDKGEYFHGAFTYNTDIFDVTTIAQMVKRFQILLVNIAADPTQHVLNLPLLTEAEQQRLTEQCCPPLETPFTGLCAHELFEAKVEQSPDAIVLVFQDQHLTYRALNSQSNRLAYHLRERGVGPTVFVGIYIETSLEAMIGLLGILKAGGVVVPLPLMNDAAISLHEQLTKVPVTVLLTQHRLVECLPTLAIEVICLDTDWPEIAQGNKENSVLQITADHLACAVSHVEISDNPQTLLLTHAGLCSWAETQIQAGHFQPGENIFSYACLNTEALFSGVFTSLIAGARLCLQSEKIALPNQDLAQFLHEQAISTLIIPSFWLNHLSAESLTRLQHIILVGDLCPTAVLAHGLPQQQVYHTGGIVEAPFWAIVDGCDNHSQRPMIGRPAPGIQVYLLDNYLQPVPDGIPGEMYIDGRALACGYHNAPQFTAKHFIPHPFSTRPGARLFKSGNIARYRTDGSLEFLGKADERIEIRGRRVETGPIEMILRQHTAVREAVVLAHKVASDDEPSLHPYKQYLVAYVVLKHDTTINALRSFLKEKLPAYQIPSVFMILDDLPHTPDGKVNRKRLPFPSETLTAPGVILQELEQGSIESEVSSQREQLSTREAKLSDAKRALLMKRLRGDNVRRK